MAPGPLSIAVLLAVAVFCFFVFMWRRFGADSVSARLAEYGELGQQLLAQAPAAQQSSLADRVGRAAQRLSFGAALTNLLRQADAPLTVTEYGLITLGLALAGLVLGQARGGLGVGLVLAGIGAYVPIMYLRSKGVARRRACADQLPDVLTMLVGMLRSGYGLNQSLNMIAEQAPSPSKAEFARVVQGMELGVRLPEALRDMAARIQSDDVDLFVTVIVIQYELGGNLADTLETISNTIRERIRLQREIRSQTAQQQLSGYVLAALPPLLALAITLINPGYLQPLLEPGLGRVLLIGTVVMQIMGFLVMKRIMVLDV